MTTKPWAGTLLALPPIEEPTKEGNTFLGWDKTVPTKMPANNDVFTALWNPCTPCNA